MLAEAELAELIVGNAIPAKPTEQQQHGVSTPSKQPDEQTIKRQLCEVAGMRITPSAAADQVSVGGCGLNQPGKQSEVRHSMPALPRVPKMPPVQSLPDTVSGRANFAPTHETLNWGVPPATDDACSHSIAPSIT